MTNLPIKNIPSEVMDRLKKTAKTLDISINALILNLIEQGLGYGSQRKVYHDLDHLAGSWSVEDEQEFYKNTAHTRKLDQ